MLRQVFANQASDAVAVEAVKLAKDFGVAPSTLEYWAGKKG